MTKAGSVRMVAVAAALAALAACNTMPKSHLSLGGGAASSCQEQSLTLYFDTNSDALTDAGRQLVDITSRKLKSCKVRELRLIGLSDPAGAAQANLELSQRRADHVLNAFVRAGVPIPHYTLVARGDAGAVAPNGAVEPVRRRVDVTLEVGN
jgi:outer membrane protein OmpA-like peptidoglycan-associated protein